MVNILLSEEFERRAKKLRKKYRSLNTDLAELLLQLEENPRAGVQIGEDIYKIRLAVRSKGKGKSGGMRVITYVDVEIQEAEEQTNVLLLTIYDKSEYDNVSDEYLRSIIDDFYASEEE